MLRVHEGVARHLDQSLVPLFDAHSMMESFYVLAGFGFPAGASSLVTIRGAYLENLYCLRCNRELENGSKSVAIYMFAQTVGIRPRQKSAARRICFCPQCAVSLAMGPPPEGTLNLAAWGMFRDLVSADPALSGAAWEALSGVERILPPTGTENSPRSPVGGYVEF